MSHIYQWSHSKHLCYWNYYSLYSVYTWLNLLVSSMLSWCLINLLQYVCSWLKILLHVDCRQESIIDLDARWVWHICSWNVLFVHAFIAKTPQVLPFFLEVVHCSVDEYLRRIPQHLHVLHRKVPFFLCCDVKDAMTVTTKKKWKIKKDINHDKTIYFWKASKETIILKQQWTKSDDESGSYGKKELWLTK